MTYTLFKKIFKGNTFRVEDLYLLESFQISYLPDYLPEREFAAILWAYPPIKTFLEKKCPDIISFIERVMVEHQPAKDQQQLEQFNDTVVWTIADLLVYNKCPEEYDRQEFNNWDFTEITSITTLENKVVIDTGAGTGRVTLEAALTARHVYSVEPVTRLRQYIRKKAKEKGLTNVFVLEGFQNSIPLPDEFADVLLTSHALGWQLEEELKEFERVTRKGGFIIHCPGTAEESRNDEHKHQRLVSEEWHYEFSQYMEADGWKRKYWKQLV
ncbi:MAG: class I SAM-dependent methyltransferase [Dehalococcoidales bacterium]|nr:MAG: class I SAM-dependent methyltransferase [Dehalococcoidales bacterium]